MLPACVFVKITLDFRKRRSTQSVDFVVAYLNFTSPFYASCFPLISVGMSVIF